MGKKVFNITIGLLALILIIWLVYFAFSKKTEDVIPANSGTASSTEAEATTTIEYTNTEYKFRFALPDSWKGYSIITTEWDGYSFDNAEQKQILVEKGPIISIRHPDWTAQNPRQDIPIMVFTIKQWNEIQANKFFIGAAPVGPSELGKNTKYVFALPARYNFAFPTGFEEVDQIINSKPLQAF